MKHCFVSKQIVKYLFLLFLDHQVIHKWAQLGLPRNPTAGAVGFLKVDISIIFRGDIHVMPVVVTEERVEE